MVIIFIGPLAVGPHEVQPSTFSAKFQAQSRHERRIARRVLLADRGSPSRSGTNFRARFGPILTPRQSETLRLGGPRSCAWEQTCTRGRKSLSGGASRQELKVTASLRHGVESHWKWKGNP